MSHPSSLGGKYSTLGLLLVIFLMSIDLSYRDLSDDTGGVVIRASICFQCFFLFLKYILFILFISSLIMCIPFHSFFLNVSDKLIF